jgi:glutamate--glyoxylate aminotransferase
MLRCEVWYLSTEKNLRELIEFCIRERLVLMADEVYQQNVYQDEWPFISARKVSFASLLVGT